MSRGAKYFITKTVEALCTPEISQKLLNLAGWIDSSGGNCLLNDKDCCPSNLRCLKWVITVSETPFARKNRRERTPETEEDEPNQEYFTIDTGALEHELEERCYTINENDPPELIEREKFQQAVAALD